jgi:dolichol-phosphate mannosyltransferase
MKISVIIPAYNEENTVVDIIKRICAVDLGLEKEIILVDDASTDNTSARAKNAGAPELKIITHDQNKGKGAAIRTGLLYVTGDIVIIQDADLEYDPQDYRELIKPLLENRSNVVYGSRTLPRIDHYSYLSYYLGGKFITFITNMLYNVKITDESTCYKVFRTELIKKLPLKCQRFEFCPEITALVAKAGEKIVDVPVHYYPRSFKEGKKIRARDGLQAIWVLLKYRIGK